MRWGLIPSWAKDPSVAARMINARSETAATKPAFRDALKSRRCLIPADGFYELTARARFHFVLSSTREM
jgi:putative SOS response-associated peptidase YedK